MKVWSISRLDSIILLWLFIRFIAASTQMFNHHRSHIQVKQFVKNFLTKWAGIISLQFVFRGQDCCTFMVPGQKKCDGTSYILTTIAIKFLKSNPSTKSMATFALFVVEQKIISWIEFRGWWLHLYRTSRLVTEKGWQPAGCARNSLYATERDCSRHMKARNCPNTNIYNRSASEYSERWLHSKFC